MKTRKLIPRHRSKRTRQAHKFADRNPQPEKWKIVDMETGQAYIGTGNNEKFKYWQQIYDSLVEKNLIQLKEPNEKLSKHISFIHETYEGLKNPNSNAARRWLGR